MTTLRAVPRTNKLGPGHLGERGAHRFDVLAEVGGEPATEASWHG